MSTAGRARRRLRLVALAAVLAPLESGCGGSPSPREEIEEAVDEHVEAIRGRDVATVCRKLFPSSILPREVAGRLDVAETSPGSSTAEWKLERQWRREFEHAELESAEPASDYSVTDVKLVLAVR